MSEHAVITQSKAVATAINAATWAQTFTAKHDYLRHIDLKNMGDTLYCSVFPAINDSSRVSRSQSTSLASVAVLFRKAVDASSNDAIDELVSQVLALKDWIYEAQIGGKTPNEVSLNGGTDELFDPDALFNGRVFLSGLVATYRI